jgi:amino acid permease
LRHEAVSSLEAKAAVVNLLTHCPALQEINLRCHDKLKRQQPEGTPIPPLLLADMTRITLGSVPEAITSSMYLTMSFTLLLAYTAKAGDIFDHAIIQNTPLESCVLGALLFTVPLATTFIRGGTPALEKTNRNLTGAMLALFVVVVCWGFTQVPWELSPLSHADTSDVTPILPIMYVF